MVKKWLDAGSGLVEMFVRPVELGEPAVLEEVADDEAAMEFSMIVVMTSLTPRVTLRSPAMPGPHGADQHGDEDDQRDLEDARQRERAADDGGEEGGEAVLAVDADVEQVHPEADGDGETRRGSTWSPC